MAPSSRFSRLSLLLFISTSQLIPQVAAAGFRQCYYPDGSIPTDIIYTACNSGPGHSGCCDSYYRDVCQDNGLCFYGSSSTNNTYRATCTDRTWKDPACPNICLDGKKTSVISSLLKTPS